MGYSSQLITTYHHLATMLDAGIPVLRAFDRVAEHAHGPLGKTLRGLSDALRHGKTVSEAVNEFPHVFAYFDRTLIRAADDSGNLDTCFSMLSDWYEFLRRMKRIVFSGLLYPVLIIHLAAAVVQLPPLLLGRVTPAGALVNMAGFLGLLFYGPLLFFWFILKYGHRVPLLREILDAITLRIPVLGKGMRELCISRFCRAFNMLYKAGVPMSECFALAPQAAGNYWIARFFQGGAQKIAEGKMPSEGFSRSLPYEYTELWTIGEESGELDKCVDKIAEIAADRADLRIRGFAKALPWMIYLIYMGVMVYLILSMAQGLYGNLDVGF